MTKVIFSGFTAAGKTTHATLLSQRTGWPLLSLVDIRNAALDSHFPDFARPAGFEWTPELDRLRESSASFDRSLDDKMSCLLREHEGDVIVDAALQPWLYRGGDAVRLWMESSPRSRVMKAAVSLLRLGRDVPDDLSRIVSDKDTFSQAMFKRLYGVDFAYDPEIFESIVDNSDYISAPTTDASDQGIKEFEVKLYDTLRIHGLQV